MPPCFGLGNAETGRRRQILDGELFATCYGRKGRNMWKTIRVDLASQSISEEEFKYPGFGNKGIIANTLTDEVDPTCDPLGDDNKLVFACGALAGTMLTSSYRLSIGAKSPITKGIKEANSGGMLAYHMSRHGIMSIIFENKAEGPCFLYVDEDGNISIDDAEEFSGLNTYATIEKIIEKYGDDNGIAVIGPAGEREYPIAGIMVNEFRNNYPCRAAARGGLGAVMGSKCLKAVIVKKRKGAAYQPTFKDPEKVKEKRLSLNKAVAEAAAEFELHKVGTPIGGERSVKSGKCPLKNYSGEIYEGHEGLYGEKYMEVVEGNGGHTGIACMPGCLVACSGEARNPDGSLMTAGFEYETLAVAGFNCGHTNIETVMKIDRLCDNAGVDTIEVGSAIGVAMEGGYLPWGDDEGAIKIAESILRGDEVGDLFGQGVETVAKHFGVTRVPTTRHQAMPGYDPRACVPTGLAFAMGTQGADHTISPSEGSFYGTPPEEVIAVYKKTEATFGVVDNMVCMMNFIFLGAHLPELAELYAAVYGGDGTPEQLFALSAETNRLEREWNEKAGWKKEDNKLPKFFFEETLPQTGHPFTVAPENLKK